MNTKKVIARILAIVMVFTSLSYSPVSSIQAEETEALAYDFDVVRRALGETSQGLEEVDRGKEDYDTALAQWDISANGTYVLSYYIVQEDKTKKVEVTFTSDGVNVTMDGKVYDIAGASQETLNYTTSKLIANEWTPQTELIGEASFGHTFKIGASPSDEKEFNIKINNIYVNRENLTIRVKLDATGKVFKYYTNGIEKGYINKFTLDNAATTDLDAEKEFFNGPKNFKVTPVHLQDKNSYESTDSITAEELKTIAPGSKPGIKVSFDPVKILVGEEFSVPSAGNAPKIQIRLKPQYTLSGTNASGDGSMTLRFNMVDGADITKEDEVTTLGTLLKEDSTDENSPFNIYLAKPVDGQYTSGIVNWEDLESSMVLISNFSLENDKEVYDPESKGHTYLKYTVSKANDNQVKFTIEPYNINAAAVYTIESSSWGDENSFTSKVIYEYDPSKTNNQEITATVDNAGMNYYRIKVSINGETYKSQTIQYQPENFISQPGITTIKTIENIYAVPNDTDISSNAYPLSIGFDMKWSAPDNLRTLLENGKLYYELMLRENKDDQDPLNTPALAGTDGYAAYSKVFAVYLDSDENVVVEAGGTGNGKGTAGQRDAEDERVAKINRYDRTNNVFSMENISLMNIGAEQNKWEQISFPSDYTYINSTDYLAGATVDDTLVDMKIPGTYYLSLRTVYVPNDTDKNFTYSTESNLEAISLDIVREVVPVPTAIACKDTTTDLESITERIQFDYVDIQNYVKKMLEPANLRLYESNKSERYSGEYIFYLYQKDKALEEVNVDELEPVTVDLNDIVHLDTLTINGKAALKVLREDGVIAFKVKIPSLEGSGAGVLNFSGLDSNQVYYLQVRTKLSPISGTGTPTEERYSILSKVFTFTTSTQAVPPTADDKKPTAPEDIKIAEEGVSKNSVTLEWKPADFEEDSDVNKTYYEFIRTDKQLTQTERPLTVEELVASNTKWVGFSSFNPNSTNYDEIDYMMTYTSQNPNWTALNPQQYASDFKLFDDTLSPNQVYYYYVRTVCIINGDTVKSDWIMVPVTTSPVGEPINLKVELEKTYDYDATEETVISFDAPIPEGAEVPTDFEFEIAVMSDDDTDYSLEYDTERITSISENTTTPDGYTHFVYKIKGLTPNKRYYIKIRIIDKTQDISDGSSYPKSSYTEPVTTRTEYDEDYAEEQEKYEDYLKKFEQEVTKLSNRDYWVVEAGVGYKYRNEYMAKQLPLNHTYDLVVEDDKEAYYYIPAEAFMQANEEKTTLNITIKEYSASIRPDTLTEENEDIKEALDKISNRAIEDYYVKVSFALNNISGTVGGQNVLTPRMTIDMEVVYLKEDEHEIESKIEKALYELVEAEKKDVIKELKEELEDGNIDDDDLSDIIDEAIADLESDLAEKVERIVDKASKKSQSVTTIQKAILLSAKVEAYAADGYYLESDWVSVDAYSAMGGFAIEAERLGVYVLTGQASLVNTVPSLAPYQNFIAQYHLTDFFTLDSYMIQTAVTKEQLYGVTARILGAPRHTDYITYLGSQNIKGVSKLLASTTAVRQDESIYIVMQAYEKIHNRSVNTIAIKNRQSIQNIGAFQPVYRSYIYAAVELKIVDTVDNRVIPSKQMTVEEMIKILYKMQAC